MVIENQPGGSMPALLLNRGILRVMCVFGNMVMTFLKSGYLLQEGEATNSKATTNTKECNELEKKFDLLESEGIVCISLVYYPWGISSKTPWRLPETHELH